jgi:hypothetical protein
MSNDDLLGAQVSLALACGRSHSSFRKKHRQTFCFLQSVLAVESKNRGQEPARAPYKA